MPDRSYSVRSAFSTNSSACLSLLKRGGCFFIMLHFPLVHAPGADRPDESFAAPRPNRKHNENSPTLSSPADCLEALLGFRVQRIRNDGDWPAKYVLDLRRRNAMLLALGPVALIPVKSGYLHPALSRHTFVKCAFLYSHSSISPAVRIFAKMNAFSAHWRPASRDNLPRRDASQAGPAGFLAMIRDHLSPYVHDVACLAAAPTVGWARAVC